MCLRSRSDLTSSVVRSSDTWAVGGRSFELLPWLMNDIEIEIEIEIEIDSF